MRSRPWNDCPRFSLAHRVTQAYEGGRSMDPNDRAAMDVAPGEIHTYRGVRASTWKAWEAFKGRRPKPVYDATADEIRELYWTWYWRAAGCHLYEPPVDLVVFDIAVNHGAGRAVRWLQATVGADVDGKPGGQTSSMTGARDPDHTAEHLLWVRARFFAQLANDPVQERNLRGWIGNRCLDLRFSWLWKDQPLPGDRPHRVEMGCWIDLRELHAQALQPSLRHRLLPGIRQVVAARYAAWHGLRDPIKPGASLLLPRRPDIATPFRPLMAFPRTTVAPTRWPWLRTLA